MTISESLKRRIPGKLKVFLKSTYYCYRWVYARLILLSPGTRLKIYRLRKMKPLKLNIGSGQANLAGWVNIDIAPGADLVVDIRRGLPFEDNSADFVYCEHVIEHFTPKEGQAALTEFRRCMRKGGVLRIATPDLDHIIQKYSADWKDQDWLSWPKHQFIETKGQMVNIAFRSWGHKYLYNEEDLINQLERVGFTKINRCDMNKSNHVELCNLETRLDSRLVLEAEKE
ncbi:MAG TPA: methyltransferase domain-containing protein [Sedimentisphaerales bacterium]|nr:methyltransferase domain-containing protein [Sedimentisphaerales bacterium]